MILWGCKRRLSSCLSNKKWIYCLVVRENQKRLLEDIIPYFEIYNKIVSDCYHSIKKSQAMKWLLIRHSFANNSLIGNIFKALVMPLADWQHVQALDIVFREDSNKTSNKQLEFKLNFLDKLCWAVLKNLMLVRNGWAYDIKVCFEPGIGTVFR